MRERLAPRVLVIGWDAADWRVINPLMDAGKMPHLRKLVERGVMGNLATLQPVLSPMLWTSIATGKRPYKHGILGFTEPTPDGAAVRPVSNLSRRTKAFWNIAHQSGLKTNVVGWWPSAPVEPIDGAMVSNHYHHASGPLDAPWPLPPGTVHPARLEQTLAELRFHPQELVPEQVLPFVPKAAEVDQDEDPRLASVMKILAECVTIHTAATWLMQNEPWDLMGVYYDAIDHFCHGFMRYHPPRRPFVDERDFELYSGVVEAGYRFHDMMLGTLLELAGDDTAVLICSDHGFHPDHNRPADIPDEPAGPAVEHRNFGIIALAGPGIRHDELLHGASLLDVTPTLLTLLGLPVGADMDGKPLVQAFAAPPDVETIPSWDAEPGDAAMHDPDRQSDPLASQEALQQLVELGYIEKLDENREKAVAKTTRELRYNLARALMDGDRHAEAAPILRELYGTEPEEHRFGLRLALCYRALGWLDPMRALVETLHTRRVEQAREAREELARLNETIETRRAESGGKELKDLLSEEERSTLRSLRGRARVRTYDVEYLRGYVAAALGEDEQALAHLLEAEKAEPRRPGLHIQIGEAYLRLRRPADAERAFERAMEIDAEDPHVHLGLARSHLRRRRGARAAESAIRSVGLLYHNPMAHFVLGRALAQMRRFEQAAEAFETAVALNPNFKEAHQRLARIYARHLDQQEKAGEHRALARAIARAGKPAPPEAAEPALGDTSRQTHAAHLATEGEPSGKPFVSVVSGLPRSGTSMMMQMLSLGGLPILSDGKREADADNPRGYFELEDAARLRSDTSWVGDAVGRGVKIVAQLLPQLPAEHAYRVVFMQRDIEEVLASQETMLARNGRRTTSLPPEKLRATYEKQIRRVRGWIGRQPNVCALYVTYADALADPRATAEALTRFLGGGLDAAAMAGAVERALHRQRVGSRALASARG